MKRTLNSKIEVETKDNEAEISNNLLLLSQNLIKSVKKYNTNFLNNYINIEELEEGVGEGSTAPSIPQKLTINLINNENTFQNKLNKSLSNFSLRLLEDLKFKKFLSGDSIKRFIYVRNYLERIFLH